MASTTAKWYRRGSEVQSGSSYIGCIGYDGGPVVGRFQFTTPGTGAATFDFVSSGLAPAGSTSWASDIGPTNFRWAITTSATANISRVSSDGYEVEDTAAPAIEATDGPVSVQLLPNTTYYLWLYPATSDYNLWRITSVSVTFGGTYGTPGTPAASNGTFGSAVAISISGGTSFATYTVQTSCGGRTETLQTKSATTSLSWTPAVATYAPLITNAASATATITVTTYYGDASVGVKTKTITLTFNASDVKAAVTLAVSDPTGYATTYGAYVATKSKIRAELTATLKYGASVSTYAISANGTTLNTNPAVTDEIVSTSNTRVTGKIVDSRGIASNTAQKTISILPYSAPQIAAFDIHRCQQDGTRDDSGAYMLVEYSVEISALNNHNSKALTVKYKQRAAVTYSTQSVTLSSYSQTGAVVIAADTNYTYDVELVLTDDFGTANVALQLSTAFTTVNFKAGGDGIAIGKVSEYSRMLELAAGWTLGVDGVDKIAQLNSLIQTVYDLTEELRSEYAKKGEIPSSVSYVDDTSARPDLTLTNGYAGINAPTLPVGAVIIAVGAISWTSSNGPSIIPYYDTNIQYDAYVTGPVGIVVKGLRCRWWYVIDKVLTSLTASYTQSGTVYDTDTLASLKPDLTVTATYSNGTTETITGYSLSGSLSAGTSTVTVSYGGRTATFSVNVTADPYPISNVRSYFRTRTETVANQVNNLSGNWQNFVFLTDPHGSANKQHSQSIALYLLAHANVSMLVLGGDYSAGYWSSAEYSNYMQPFLNSGMMDRIYALCGNHEVTGSGSAAASKTAIYSDFLQSKTGLTGNLQNLYWYLDSPTKKTRYLFLNTSDTGEPYEMTSTQISWITQSVALPASDWSLVVLGHVNLAQMAGVTYGNESNGAAVISAINNCNGKVVGYICGHQHIDYCELIGSFQHTTLLCDRFENTNYYDGISLTNRVEGTDTEQAVTVVSINTTTKQVVFRRIGAGRSQTISYSYS